MTVDFSPAVLAAEAGVDPWSLAQQVRSGDPNALQAGALRLRRAGQLAAEAATAGERADRILAVGFRNDGVTVFDAPASSGRGAALLAARGEKIEEAARAVLDVATALSDTGLRTASTIAALDADLSRIIALNAGISISEPDPATAAAALTAAEQRYFRMAVDLVRETGGRVQAALGTYDAVLANRSARLAGLGYGAPPADLTTTAGHETVAASIGAGTRFEGAADLLGALARAAVARPEAVLGLLVGLGAIAQGAAVVVGGVGVTAGTGGAGVVVGGPAVAGGLVLAGVGGALVAASAAEIARATADELSDPPPATTPKARRAVVREAVLNPDDSLPGEPGISRRVRVVEEEQVEQIEQAIRERLGPPDQVIEKPGQGTVEVWDVSSTETVVIRDFSRSAARGLAGDTTIDIRVQGLEEVRKIHVRP